MFRRPYLEPGEQLAEPSFSDPTVLDLLNVLEVPIDLSKPDILEDLAPFARLFTSESVCAGHPDKICDAISDAIVDATLVQDPHAHTGIETVAGANQICLFGEINTTADIDFEKIANGQRK